MKSKITFAKGILLLLGFHTSINVFSQTVTIDATTTGRNQVIDGFGTCLYGNVGESPWFQDMYYSNAMCSILRMDLVPQFAAPYSDNAYNSPWFGVATALPGPDNNNVRTYTNAGDYIRLFDNKRAQIAVMEPDINKNILKFNFNAESPRVAIAMAKAGALKKAALGDFKFTASIWSPAPWLKVSSGNNVSASNWPLPVGGTPFPFVWGGNYSGGKLDVSNIPKTEFFDGVQNTSALTQFARSTAAYVKGIQDKSGVKFYAISIQNELNFEVFYNSCTYALSDQYIAALKVVRKEFDKYDDLKGIKIMGPEDLLGDNGYSMWQYGSGATATHKNLQYLTEIAKDPAATGAIDYYCIHGYASDGVSSGGSNATAWDWWANGWKTAPGGGIPDNIKGFRAYNKKSWMTETSGENEAWLYPTTGFPNDGGFSIALKIHQALTAGYQSGWVYWQFGDGSATSNSTLTDETKKETVPKYNAFKHFSKYIRPNAVRLNATIAGGTNLNVSSYIHDANKTLSMVLINSNPTAQAVTVNIPTVPFTLSKFESYTSSDNYYWQAKPLTMAANKVSVTIPGYGVTTLFGQGTTFATGINGSDEVAVSSLIAYPNPFSQEIAVNFNSLSTSKITLKVTDMKGLTVFTSDKFETNQEIKFGKELMPGTYIISASDSNGAQKTIKVDKQ